MQSLFVWDYGRESTRTAGRLLAASDAVGRGRREATVLIDILGRFRSNPVLHADCLLGVDTGNVIWADYETNYYYFPVQLRDPDVDAPRRAAGDPRPDRRPGRRGETRGALVRLPRPPRGGRSTSS